MSEENRQARTNVLRIGAGLFVARVLQPLFSFALFWACARKLSLEDFGIYALLMGLVLVFQTCATLGLGPLLTREAATDTAHTPAWAGSALAVLSAGALGAWAAWILFCLACGYPDKTLTGSAILGVGLPAACAVQVMESIFVANDRSRAVVVQSLLENALRVAASLAALGLGGGLTALFVIHAASRTVGGIMALMFLRGVAGGAFTFDRSRAALLLRGLPTFGVMVICAALFFRVDIIVASILLPESDIGLFTGAIRLVTLCFLLPESYVSAVYPALSRLMRDDPRHGRELVSVSVAGLLVLCVPVSLVLCAASPVIVPLLYGQAFTPAVPLLAILAFLLPAHALNGLLGFAIQAGRKDAWAMGVVLAGLFLNIAANVAGALAGGITGTAWADFGVMTGLALAYLVIVSRLYFPIRTGRVGAVLAAACLAGLGCLIWLGGGLPAAVLSPLAFAAVLGAGGVLTPASLRRALGLVIQARGKPCACSS